MKEVNNSAKVLVDHIIEGIQEKKGTKIAILDLKDIDNTICQYFVICEGTSFFGSPYSAVICMLVALGSIIGFWRGIPRITSYNVCYTKLLRIVLLKIGFDHAGVLFSPKMPFS